MVKFLIKEGAGDTDIKEAVTDSNSYRIKKYIYKSNTWEELVKNIKTKRYTYNKINRMLTHILLGYTKEENKEKIAKILAEIEAEAQAGKIHCPDGPCSGIRRGGLCTEPCGGPTGHGYLSGYPV